MTARRVVVNGVAYVAVVSPDRPVDDGLADPIPWMNEWFDTEE